MAYDGPKLVEVLLLLLMVKMFQNLDLGHDCLGSPLSNIKMEVYLVNGIVMLLSRSLDVSMTFLYMVALGLSPCSFFGSRKVLPI